MSGRRAGLLLSCALAVAGFAWWSWPLAGHLATHTLILAEDPALTEAQRAARADWDLIVANDQNLSLWGAVDNARALLRGDLRGLLTQGQCYPMPDSTALGEHMFEVGVLAAPWWLAVGEPVAAYNLALLTALVVAASGMFLFLHRHAASVPASVAGALAFAFAVPRLVDLPYHPAVIGTHWLPWVLWSFDRVLAREGFGAVAAFAVTLLLASVTGSYPLIAVGLVGAAYGVASIAGRARRGELDVRALLFGAAGAVPAVVVVATVLSVYSGLQREWLLPTNPDVKFLVTARDYLPGGVMPAGLVALGGLALLMVRRRGEAGSAVPALAVATVAAFLMTTRLPLPGGAWSVYEALAEQVPLLDSVRAPGKAGLAVVFGLQALGAIGWSRAMQALSPRMAAALGALLVAVVFAEASPPVAARALLGGAAMQLREVAPSREHLETLTGALPSDDRRAVLDLPTGRMVKAPVALLDAAWHGHPTSACYNSLIPPTMREVYAMAARSHSRRGVEELAAAGFGFVIERPASPRQPLSPTSFPGPARLVALGADVAVWALPPPPAAEHDPKPLALEVKGGATRAATFAPEPPHELDVEVTNRGARMWTPALPLRPLLADVELRSGDGAVILRARARGLLPLALAPGAATTVQLTMPEAPPPGSYAATVRIEGFADAVVPAQLAWAGPPR